MNRMAKLAAAAIGALLLICGPANAALIGYQSQAAFNAAISGWTITTTTFEAVAVGTMFGTGTGPAGSGFTLMLVSPGAPTASPTVADQFWTTSGARYLGLDNPDTAFQAGDALTFNFSSPAQAFGLFVIGTRDIGAGDISLTAGASSVSNGATFDMTDNNGSYAYFLGLVSDGAGTFGSAVLSDLTDLTPASSRLLNIALDDVALGLNTPPVVNPPVTGVPEPGSLVLMSMGLLAFGIATRRRIRRHFIR
jgi:hypothetical protein